MRLEELLREVSGPASGLDGLTLWRTNDGQWQASARRQGSSGFVVEIRPDIADAIDAVLASRFGSDVPAFVGFGAKGPVSPAMKRLAAAIADNAAIREAMGR
jgi:hypothetical protein